MQPGSILHTTTMRFHGPHMAHNGPKVEESTLMRCLAQINLAPLSIFVMKKDFFFSRVYISCQEIHLC